MPSTFFGVHPRACLGSAHLSQHRGQPVESAVPFPLMLLLWLEARPFLPARVVSVFRSFCLVVVPNGSERPGLLPSPGGRQNTYRPASSSSSSSSSGSPPAEAERATLPHLSTIYQLSIINYHHTPGQLTGRSSIDDPLVRVATIGTDPRFNRTGSQ
mmetsp:Transcript_7943/g.16387  ORF Transcript_7943/g.16387 Transcript_7943/m.16387 type:complete len:157 (+) Transcript_7943:482-952(+)